MARIRTIKPDFFTSDDVCALSPLARLLYVALWCEADREGRLAWAPRVPKRRYLPEDECDVEALAGELIGRGLVVPYGAGLAFIPTFTKHQQINARELASRLPPPVTDASPRVPHAPVGREGKGIGREGEGKAPAGRAHALPQGWTPDPEDLAWVAAARPDLDRAALDAETERFANHSHAHQRTAHVWGPNWRLWVSKAYPPRREPRAERTAGGVPEVETELQWRARLRNYRPGKFWMEGDWGPRPETGKCRAPAGVLEEWRGAEGRRVQ